MDVTVLAPFFILYFTMPQIDGQSFPGQQDNPFLPPHPDWIPDDDNYVHSPMRPPGWTPDSLDHTPNDNPGVTPPRRTPVPEYGLPNDGDSSSSPNGDGRNSGRPPTDSSSWQNQPNFQIPDGERTRHNLLAYHDIFFPDIKYHHEPTYDYAEALAKSMLFYEAQRSGQLPYDHRIPWRGDSALTDGGDAGVDLSGGYYDGEGYIKYGFPMAYTTTVLSWGVIRYRRTYEAIDQLQHALDTIKWATDYFLKCKQGPTNFFGQVSDQASDSSYNGKPEDMGYTRRSYGLSPRRPGSEIVGETAAALAAASIVFYETDRAYSEVLIDNAIELYTFANKFRGDYHSSIKPVDGAYRSHSGYKDELAWAAAWIYRRTGISTYLKKAKQMYKVGGLSTMGKYFSWDDKKVGVQMLMAELTGNKQYKNSVQEFCDYCLPSSGKSKHTPLGLLHVAVANWGALRYAANAAFICSLASDMNMKSNEYRLFALTQMNYILGSTGRSYVVGFGENPPKKYRHKASYCKDLDAACPQFSQNLDNAHVLYGALVGGPSETDQYADALTNREQCSVSLDYNAGFQSALAAVLDLHIFGMEDRPKLDKPGEITAESDAQASPEEVAELRDITHDYAQALSYSLLFYEAQRSGKLRADSRVPWRRDSALYDGEKVNWDLTGGYYDGGDYVKYTYPLAFTMTLLSWGLIEFHDAYTSTSNLNHIMDALVWGSEYLEKTHVEEQDILITQVGDAYYESGSWDRPDYINKSTNRPVKYVSKDFPGSDVASEVAAAFAAMSLAFQNVTSDEYRENLITRAKGLFKFANENRGIYSDNKPRSVSKGVYDSTGYEDELAWAAMWIYKATSDSTYFNYAKSIYNSGELLSTPTSFSYDDKRAGLHLMFAEKNYDVTEITKFCSQVTSSAKRTPKGLFYDAQPPTKHAGNVAFILLLASEKFKSHPESPKWRYYGRDQIDYILGSTGQSFMVGYGEKYPEQPHHKASSCPLVPLPCGESYKYNPGANKQVLYGAVVAGPGEKDVFQDVRTRKKYTAVSLDTNAGVQSSLAALHILKQKGLLNSAPKATHFVNKYPALFSILIIFVCRYLFYTL